MSMHIGAKAGEISDKVILPGDPLRAKYIAEHYLQEAICINSIRGMLGYTGFYQGQKVSIIPTGMGTPSMMIYLHELCIEYGCKKAIRTGTAGAMQEKIQLGDIILSQAVSTTSAINAYVLPGHFSLSADFHLLSKAYHLSQKKDLSLHVGSTLCNDHFYIPNKLEYSKIWSQYGIMASEQEGAGLYSLASYYNIQALMVLTVVINLYRPEETLSDETKESGLDGMIQLALDTIID
ncbi:MAG: purine-nucleoside phosphorylase [Clostridiales bacterium]|nr:purine-nucleoside phosphorylase [Clostridiales bacterium]